MMYWMQATTSIHDSWCTWRIVYLLCWIVSNRLNMHLFRSIADLSSIFFLTHLPGVQVDSSRNTQRNQSLFASDVHWIGDETNQVPLLVLVVIPQKNAHCPHPLLITYQRLADVDHDIHRWLILYLTHALHRLLNSGQNLEHAVIEIYCCLLVDILSRILCGRSSEKLKK